MFWIGRVGGSITQPVAPMQKLMILMVTLLPWYIIKLDENLKHKDMHVNCWPLSLFDIQVINTVASSYPDCSPVHDHCKGCWKRGNTMRLAWPSMPALLPCVHHMIAYCGFSYVELLAEKWTSHDLSACLLPYCMQLCFVSGDHAWWRFLGMIDGAYWSELHVL